MDPYFPINQAALRLESAQGNIRVNLRTLTPNLKAYQARRDGETWTEVGESLVWSLHPGLNRLEVKTLNRFGVEGPVSTVEAILED